MSWFTSGENAVGTAAKWFLKMFAKAQTAAPAVHQIADRVFPWAKMVVDGVLVAEGGGAIVAEANAVMDEIHRDLDVACAALYDVGATPTVTTFVQSLAAHIDDLVTAGHVKSAGNIALIKNVVRSLLSLVGITPAPAAAPAVAK